MRTLLRRTGTTACSAALLFGTAVPVVAVAAPAEPLAIECETSTSNGETFYDGKSASYDYDDRFAAGPELSKTELSKFTPQGAAWWSNWDGDDDLVLATTYSEDATISHIVGLDPDKTGQDAVVGIVRIDKSHVGGIAIHGDWVFVSGPDRTIQKYRTSDLADAMKKGKPGEDKVRIKPVGADRKVYGSSFMTVDGDYLYAGRFNDAGRDKMYRYEISEDGTLTTQKGAWEVPTKTQGLFVHDGRIVYSTSYGRENRGNIYSVDGSEKDLDKASPACFRAPSMAEGITTADNGKAYLLFESGSHKYDGSDGDRARNVIRGFHQAEIGDLSSY